MKTYLTVTLCLTRIAPYSTKKMTKCDLNNTLTNRIHYILNNLVRYSNSTIEIV